MFILRQSTAVDVLIGPFVDGTDGVTTEEAESPSVQLSKNGQTAATKNEGTTPAHDNAGYYNCVFNATDTNTVGTMVAFIEGSTATFLQVRHEFQIMDTAAFDALFADGAEGPLQATTVGNTLDVSATGEAGLDWANIGSPTTAQNLSGTNIDVDQIVASVSGAVGSVTAAVTVGTMNANVIDAASIATSAMDGKGDWNIGKTGYALTTADWNVGKTGYSLTATTGLGAQTANITGNLSGSVGSVSGTVGSVTGAVGSVAGNVDGNVTGSVGLNLELGPTEVNAQMVDVLFTDTDAEPVKGAPGATISLADKIGFLYKSWRNRSTQNATTYSLFNDDATTVDHDATVSDDTTTADRGEMTDGP